MFWQNNPIGHIESLAWRIVLRVVGSEVDPHVTRLHVHNTCVRVLASEGSVGPVKHVPA